MDHLSHIDLTIHYTCRRHEQLSGRVYLHEPIPVWTLYDGRHCPDDDQIGVDLSVPHDGHLGTGHDH